MQQFRKGDGGDSPSSYMLEWLNAQTSGPIANVGAPAGEEDNQEFAGRLYQLCLRALHDFCNQQRDQHSSKSRLIALRERLGGLYLWGEPFGVGGLDKALRQSDELGDKVLEHLGYIGKLLLRKFVPSIPSPRATQLSVKQIEELESAIKHGKLLVSKDLGEIPQDGHGQYEEYDSGEDSLSDSGSYDTVDDIGFATACLLELRPSLEQNLVRAEAALDNHSNPTRLPFSVSGPAAPYVSLIREKFQKAHVKLVERLGEANWQRHKEVREKMEIPELSSEERTKLAGSSFRSYSEFHDSGIGTSVPAQIEYAQSHTSFQSSNMDGEQVSLRVPKEPSEVVTGKPFQCFLCKRIVTNIRNRVDWKMHVFADLRPYICTFLDCKHELAQFTNRAAWADHEFTEHRHDWMWHCPECSDKLASAPDWEKHLQDIHRRVFTGQQLYVVRNTACQLHPRPVETEACPLCRVVLGKPRREFTRHVARHMEEIALMALPHGTEDDSDESSVSADEITQTSEHAELRATRPVGLPGSAEEDLDESSVNTLKNPFGSESAELLPNQTGNEARQERTHDQTDQHSTNEITNQQELSQKMETVDLNQGSSVTAASGAALNATEAHAPHIVDRRISPLGPPVSPSPGGFSSVSPHRPRLTYWNCGICGHGPMTIKFNTHCTFCHHRKAYNSAEYE